MRLPRLRAWTLAALLALGFATASATVLARSSVRHQERALLESRGADAKSFLNNAIGAIRQRILVLAGALQVGTSELETFNEVGRPLVGEDETFDALALVDTTVEPPVVLTALGEGLESGQTLTGASAEAIERAGGQFTSTGVFETGDTRRWGAAIGAPVLPEDRAIYGESAIEPPEEPEDPTEAFADIKVVLYGRDEASEDQLLAANTTEYPLDGPIERVEFEFGADIWLMEVAPRESLVGTATRQLPWLVVGLGALVTLAVTALVETLQRRRDYAVALVDERTHTLEATVGDLELARAELLEADRLKDEFLDIAAHELRTPLTAIAGFAEILTGQQPPEPEMHDRLLTRVRVNAQVMEELTNQLLDLSRLRAGRVAIHRERVVLEDAVARATLAVGELLDTRPVLLEIPPGLAADADPKALQRVLVNLLTNAAKFSPADTPITIGATEHVTGVTVKVVDRGVGVPEQEQERIFERFYRAPGTGDVTRGTGIGLTIVARYVELHGGEMGVESAEGQGSTFWFTLPAATVGVP